MNWEASNFEEEGTDEIQAGSPLISLKTKTAKIEEKNAEQKVLQLKRYLDPAKDVIRQSYMNLMSKFANFQIQNKSQEITEVLLAADCKTFVFCSRTERPPVQYAPEAKEFVKLFEHIKIKAIRVRETYADIEKQTGFQICNYEVLYGDGNIVHNEVVTNIFSFKDERICKLRALFAYTDERHGSEDYLALSPKERMFAKVKEINYALAGDQPDLQKASAIFSENTVYRIWRWDDLKCFVFSKHDFSEKFRELEEDYAIKCIVPYEITFDRDFVAGTYGYYLEKKSTGQKYVWFSTCIYAFDEHINLLKVSQQGELLLEEDAVNPFEVYSKDKTEQNVKEMFEIMKFNYDWFYKDLVHSTVNISRFMPDSFARIAPIRGIGHVEKFWDSVKPMVLNVDWIRLVDVFIDQHGPSYDTVLTLVCGEGISSLEKYKYKDKQINFFSFYRIEFEKGKAIKILQNLFEIPYLILSPFDNPEFSAINIKSMEPTETV